MTKLTTKDEVKDNSIKNRQLKIDKDVVLKSQLHELDILDLNKVNKVDSPSATSTRPSNSTSTRYTNSLWKRNKLSK